jgi:Asp-tRNA(Asn)/Glu-tRNA(Gln) amidotransferase C subunit
MTDLTPEHVRHLAEMIGLSIEDDDLEDVAFRLNATLEHLAELERLEPQG